MDLARSLEERGTVLLDASLHPGASCFLYRNPVEELSAARPSDISDLLQSLDEAVASGARVAGYLAYEIGYGLEPGRFAEVADVDYGAQLGYPVAWFGIYDRRTELSSADVGHALKLHLPADPVLGLELDQTGDLYRSRVERVRDLIREGDVYQVNYTGRLTGAVTRGAAALYARMRRRQPVSYGAFVQLGDVQLLSASPERFVEWTGDRLEARPMKGTAPRGGTPALDNALADWLRTDTKSRAENLMIVDLLRNDLSVVCLPGSVRVPSLFEIERYDTVLQMTSTVTGRTPPEQAQSEILRALFPCGSVTGAPKIRAMRRILELEETPRGIYCGAIGHLSRGAGAFNVAIRTIVLRDGNVTLGSGGGIVWDSEPEEEYRECLLKSRFIAEKEQGPSSDIHIIETMLWDDGFPLRDSHLDRLTRTAAALGFRCPISDVVDRLETLDRELRGRPAQRVRLLLGASGSVSVESTPAPPPGDEPLRVALSEKRIDSANPFLRWKTTFRGAYEAGRREARRRRLDEVLFLNERGELTEGAFTNIFLRIDGRWFTPPLSSGVLPGIARELEMQSERKPGERVLYASDLARAEAIVLTNAVRGRREAEFVAP